MRATVEVGDSWGVHAPVGCAKMRRAALLTAKHVSPVPLQVTLSEHTNPIPVGRGCASSTADVLATIRAVAGACGVTLTAGVQASLCSTVESSDGLAFPGLAAVNHRTGRLVRELTWTPAFEVVAVLPERSLNTSTVAFAGKDALGRVFDRLLDQLVTGCAMQDAGAVADVATASALLNQPWVPNPLLAGLLDRMGDVGALGVAVAHTGTAAAWLFALGSALQAAARDELDPAAGTVVHLRVTEVPATPEPSRPVATRCSRPRRRRDSGGSAQTDR